MTRSPDGVTPWPNTRASDAAFVSPFVCNCVCSFNGGEILKPLLPVYPVCENNRQFWKVPRPVEAVRVAVDLDDDVVFLRAVRVLLVVAFAIKQSS